MKDLINLRRKSENRRRTETKLNRRTKNKFQENECKIFNIQGHCDIDL